MNKSNGKKFHQKEVLVNSPITCRQDFKQPETYVIVRIKTRSKSSTHVTMDLAVLGDAANSRDETIPNFSKELKIEI